MPNYNLAKLRADQPNLWLPLLLPACMLACEAQPGAVSTFEVTHLAEGARDPAVEEWSLVHAVDLSAPDLEALARAPREDLLHVGAACVITAILRSRGDVRVRRVARRGAGLDFHLERVGGAPAGVLVVVGAAGTDTASALADAGKLLEGAPAAPRFAGAVAFGGKKAAIRVVS